MNCLAILVSFMVFGLSSSVLKEEDSVKLTVFYESYCPDSIRFVVNQLHSIWKDLKDFIQLELVPFGFAQQRYVNGLNGYFEFTCQHGDKECTANVLHSCAIYQMCGSKGSLGCPVDHLTKVVDYLSCVMQEREQWDASQQCAIEAGLDHLAIVTCAVNFLGQWLESGYGNATTAFNKTTTIDYIPFIVINDHHTKEEQRKAESDLKELICKYIPQHCNDLEESPNIVLVL